MRENRISIKINKPISEVFEFTINPANTPRWIESIRHEQTNERPIKIGTVYWNINMTGKRSAYVVFAIEASKLFELISEDGKYHVCYAYTKVADNITKMEYHEWVDVGDLEEPFAQSVLKKL